MNKTTSTRTLHLSALSFLVSSVLITSAHADAVTDWNDYTIKATKGFDGATGTGVTLNSNLSSRIEAIEARAVFDAVNSIDHFSATSYYFSGSNSGSPAAAAIQAAHDVLLSQLPDPTVTGSTADARWSQTRTWLDTQLSADLGALGVAANDGGIQAGKDAALAAVNARKYDNASLNTTYGATLIPTSNPGIGLWRQSNGGADKIDSSTGAPTGFDSTGSIILGKAGIDFNWRDVTPFSLTHHQKVKLVAAVPLCPEVGSQEYLEELDYVKNYGQDSSAVRSPDQTAQALYYKIDAELFINEVARIASNARNFSLDENAKLFAALGNAIADTRIAAFDSKYEQKFWRPITAINADEDGAVTNNYAAWHPLAATPSHPSNTAGHSATGAAGFEILRAFFGDKIKPNGAAVTLGTLPWLTGTNSGTGNISSRTVKSFTQAQLENGASRLYLGVHFGYDNLQGQLLGLSVADTIIQSSHDPATEGLTVKKDSAGSYSKIKKTLLKKPELYGYFGQITETP